MEPFENTPGKHQLEIYEYQAGDPRYEVAMPPGAIVIRPSVASFRRQIGGEEGIIVGPNGDRYFISLKPWAAADQETTMLHMEFRFTPEFTPLTRQQLLEMPPPMPDPSYTPPPHRHTANFPGRPIYTMCSDVRYDHKLTLRPGLVGKSTTTADDLANLPDATRVVPVFCPVCDAVVRMTEPLAAYVQELREVLGETNPLMELSITHPVDITETKIQPENSPLVVNRYWRYSPVSVTPTVRTSTRLKVEVQSKNHLITVELGAAGVAGSFPARQLFHLPEATQTELECPLCAERLPFYVPFQGFIDEMGKEQGDADRMLIWSISHPTDQPETRSPEPAALIAARRHAPLASEIYPLDREGKPIIFML